MAKRIRIKAGPIEALAELADNRTAQAIWQALPIRGEVNLWGEEIYFSIPVKIEQEDGREVVKIGELGYWPPGSAFCIFFGRTPVSGAGEVRAASAVNVFGKVIGDTSLFKMVASGAEITIERAESG